MTEESGKQGESDYVFKEIDSKKRENDDFNIRKNSF